MTLDFPYLSANAFVVQSLQCNPGTSGPAPSSFVLFRKAPGETAYTAAVEQANCNFTDITIIDTGETCFKFAAKNAIGVAVRNDTTICIDPRNAPLSPPNTLEVK